VTTPGPVRGLAAATLILLVAGCGAGPASKVPPGPSAAASSSPTPTVTASGQTELSAKLLSGAFEVPEGFTVSEINPFVPADASPFGAVDSTVMSPTGVTYSVAFSPVDVPCEYAMCTSPTSTMTVGNSTPYGAQTTFDPDLREPAMCGFDSDAGEVGCDTIIGEEYLSVNATGPDVSTADAIAVLRAAIAYLAAVQG